jgi:hypothetical protein
MRTFTVAAVMVALLTAPAYAQGMGKSKQRGTPQKSEQRVKTDDKAYKAALDKIPDAEKKRDPWQDVRPSTPPGGTR